MIEFIFKNELSETDIEQIEVFCKDLDFAPIEQHPEWNKKIEQKTVVYFIARENNHIVCYSVINETKAGLLKFASIRLGPLFKEPDYLISSLFEIKRHYGKRKFLYLSVQLSLFSGAVTDYIEAKFHQLTRFTNSFDRNNWSSIMIRLDQDMETIYKNFRSDHKRSLKKAEKAKLIVRHAESGSDIKELAHIYHKMEMHKKFGSHSMEFIKNHFIQVYDFIKKTERGFVLVVTDESGEILGGIFNVFQGQRVRVFKGGADPQKKNLPLMHAAIFESIKVAKSLGFKYLDLWGYNHYVDKNDQIYNINLFKRGFGGEFIFYPKIMHIQLFPFGRLILNTMIGLRKKAKLILHVEKK